MAEPKIPASLIDRLRAGRAALIVGGSIGTLAGLPSWKKALERLRDQLEKRGKDGDREAADDLGNLLKKGRLTSATGFLARTLGTEACDRVLAEAWSSPQELPESIQALGKIPARAIWTTFAGDLVERAVAAGSPADWPASR